MVLVTAFRERERPACAASRRAPTTSCTIPVNRHELLARVRSLLRLRTYHRDLEDHQSVVLSLASLLEAKDPYTRGHSARVGELACRLAQEAGLPPDECELMRVAGLLHDIGKVGMPGRDHQQAGPPHAARSSSRSSTHPADGESLCRPLKTVQAVLPLIRHHHERFDGRGYPDQPQGRGRSPAARVSWPWPTPTTRSPRTARTAPASPSRRRSTCSPGRRRTAAGTPARSPSPAGRSSRTVSRPPPCASTSPSSPCTPPFHGGAPAP